MIYHNNSVRQRDDIRKKRGIKSRYEEIKYKLLQIILPQVCLKLQLLRTSSNVQQRSRGSRLLTVHLGHSHLALLQVDTFEIRGTTAIIGSLHSLGQLWV